MIFKINFSVSLNILCINNLKLLDHVKKTKLVDYEIKIKGNFLRNMIFKFSELG